jgi:transglutaminase-like putative cysteine protease
MHLSITHQTRYCYHPSVGNALHMAHLSPRNTADQHLVSHALHISPEVAHRQSTWDVFGNAVQYFSLQAPHSELVVTARSQVTTDPVPKPSLEDSLPWERVRQHFQYQADKPYDPANEFVFPSAYVPWDGEFASYAQSAFQGGRPLWQAAQALMEKIHHEFEYAPNSTQINTPARQALSQRQGVCQDFAHIMLACCRSLNLSARYVSGYLLTQPPPGQSRLIGNDATHAWVSVYDPQHKLWLDFDPTNNRLRGEDYVTVAWGRDFGDVSPMRGVIHGGANQTLEVAVTVEPLDASKERDGFVK